jgi:hypothetical protein
MPHQTQKDPKPATDTAAQVKPTKAQKAADTAAVVERDGLPRPKIIVTTSIQPLGKAESLSMLGTTRSKFFDATFREVGRLSGGWERLRIFGCMRLELWV